MSDPITIERVGQAEWEAGFRSTAAAEGREPEWIEKWVRIYRIEEWVEERAGSLSGEARLELHESLLWLWGAGR